MDFYKFFAFIFSLMQLVLAQAFSKNSRKKAQKTGFSTLKARNFANPLREIPSCEESQVDLQRILSPDDIAMQHLADVFGPANQMACLLRSLLLTVFNFSQQTRKILS
ncbi:MAG: hypothetical protein ABSA83_04280 [Verrucomicrobiota bacterium]|jgi:hypothetical protein